MKMWRFKSHRWKLILATALLVLSSAPAVMAQCAMCRTAVESTGGGLAKSLNLGIIVLLIPPVAIFCAIFVTAYKHRKAPSDVTKNVS
jgi:heme/copper-type cytochrome/quinol oxidase subunit 3